MRKVSLEDDDYYITVWKDGTFRVSALLTAMAYEHDSDFLINIPLDSIPQLLQKV